MLVDELHEVRKICARADVDSVDVRVAGQEREEACFRCPETGQDPDECEMSFWGER